MRAFANTPHVYLVNPSSLETLAESRRLLRAILTRRDFLAVGGSMAGLALAGCGSGDSPTGTTIPPVVPPVVPPGQVIPEGLSAISGTISLPVGSTLKPATLSVDVSSQIVPVTTTGTFTVGVAPGGPSLALLTDATGNGVLMSLITSGSGQTISARTSAVALFYYATSAFTLPDSVVSQALALINSDPAMTALETAIANAVAADPHAIINDAAPIGPAIVAAMTAMLGTTPALAAPANAHSLANANTQAVGVATLMTVLPVDEQNGVKIEKEEGTTALLTSNSKRRACKVYVYEVETLVDGKTAATVPPVVETGPIDLAATTGVGIFTGLRDLTTWIGLGTHTIFQPVKLDAIPLLLHPANADQTVYKAIVIAASWKSWFGDVHEPAFFHDAYWSKELPAWRDEASNLFLAAVLGDLLMPLVCLWAGFKVTKQPGKIIQGIVAEGKASANATFKHLLGNLGFGGLGEVGPGMQKIVVEAFSSDISTEWYGSKMQKLLTTAEAKALASQKLVETQSSVLGRAKMFEKIFKSLFRVGAVLEVWDLGALIYDLWNSDIASLRTVTLTRQKLGLLPVDPRIGSGGEVTFTVEQPVNNNGGVYTYEWTQTSLFATFSVVDEPNTGASVTTTKRAVKLRTTGGDKTPISVLVVGYDTRTLPRTEIGRAGTTVSFYYPAEILPSNAILQLQQVQPFSVIITGGELPTDIVYKWTVVGTAGTLGGQTTLTTPTPQVTFTAGNLPGSSTLEVQAVNTAGTIFAKTSAPIGVEFPAVIQPSNVIVSSGQEQVYTVTVTGQLPLGMLYKWTLAGGVGALSGQATITTVIPQVTFKAGSSPGSGTLHVDVVTAAGVRWAHADATINVSRVPSITFTLAGPWDSTKMPANATYSYLSQYDGRVHLESEPGLDQIGFVYNVGSDDTIGVFVAIHVQAGRVIKTGDTFTKYSNTANAGNTNGTYQFLLSNNQTDADAPGAQQTVPEGTGNLKFDDVSRLADGTWVVNYSFKITSPAGATCVAVGAAKWK